MQTVGNSTLQCNQQERTMEMENDECRMSNDEGITNLE